MLVVLFYYTLVIMLANAIAASVSLSAYFVSRRKTFLYAAIALVFYFFDVSLVFLDDFVTPSAVTDAATFYDVGNPLVSVVTGGGTFLFLWMCLCHFMDRASRAREIVPIVIWAVVSIAILELVPDPQWREFSFYSMREVLLAYFFISMIGWDRNSKNQRHFSRWQRHILYLTIACAVGIVLENVYVQLIFQPSTMPSDMWFFAERSIMENLMFICIDVAFIRAGAETLQLRYENPPKREDAKMAESIDRLLPVYSKHHGLSNREAEVLTLIVMGKDNQNIASEMNLALSTVKVHVHNILKKTGQPDRQSLTKDFWSN
jgi:DNA-binding CsgD family transcriptional regulator